MEKVPITRQGHRDLRRDLRRLRREARPEALEELREARAFGVKIDNQQYLLALERWSVVQRKIEDLEEKLARCEVVVGRKFRYKQAGFGTVIDVESLDTGRTFRYQLVGPYESDVGQGKLSVESPVGNGLLDRFEGDEVTVCTPGGLRAYRILSIRA